MSPFAPFTEDQFRLMAMCKARAYTWDSIAETVNMPIEIVERVAWTHEKPWNRFLTKAERHIARETISEVAGVLRKDIRNAEPKYQAPLANSLARLLKLQQDYAPPTRPRRTPLAPSVPTSAPITPAPTPPPTKPTTSPLPLGGTLASLLGFFVLLGALLMGCWNKAQRIAEHPEEMVSEPVATLVEGPTERGPTAACRSGFSLTRPPAATASHISSG